MIGDSAITVRPVFSLTIAKCVRIMPVTAPSWLPGLRKRQPDYGYLLRRDIAPLGAFRPYQVAAMLADITISARDVAQAGERVRACEEAWQRFGRRVVQEGDFREAQAYTSQCRRELRQLYASSWKAAKVKLALLWLPERMFWLVDCVGVTTGRWLVCGLIVGVAAVALALIPLIAVFGHALPFLLGMTACFLLVSSLAAGTFFYLSGRDLSAEVAALRARLKARNLHIASFRERLRQWTDELALLHQIRDAQARYQHAAQQHARLLELLKSRRYRLAHSDWRSLRSTAFEDFIGEVFEDLGFLVEKTKVTGDQGVDLIVTGKGRRIAVQTKGYKDSVGNHAVQEVHTGMVFYTCRECLVVTNSRFTSAAVDLARSVGCILIDGSRIPELIEGKLY
jgi:restriction system protein